MSRKPRKSLVFGRGSEQEPALLFRLVGISDAKDPGKGQQVYGWVREMAIQERDLGYIYGCTNQDNVCCKGHSDNR